MKNADKIDFIFQTSSRGRIYIENKVFSVSGDNGSLLDDLSSVQVKIAMHILQKEPISLSELAHDLGLSTPSSSVIVEKLVEKNVISRVTDPADRRRVQLRIDPHALKEMNALQSRLQNAFQEIARKVGDDDLERWYQVAIRINEILNEEAETQ